MIQIPNVENATVTKRSMPSVININLSSAERVQGLGLVKTPVTTTAPIFVRENDLSFHVTIHMNDSHFL